MAVNFGLACSELRGGWRKSRPATLLSKSPRVKNVVVAKHRYCAQNPRFWRRKSAYLRHRLLTTRNKKAYTSQVLFKSKSAASAATIIAGGWTVSLFVINAHPGLHSTPGIWAAVLGIPGVVVGAWIQHYQTGPSRLGDIVAYSAMGATNWLFWFAIARTSPETPEQS